MKRGKLMGRTIRRKQNGTGPYKDSFQRKQFGGIGKRKQKGQKCPKQK